MSRRGSLFLAATAIVAVACVDTTPLTYEPKTELPGSDASAEGGLEAACRSCLLDYSDGGPCGASSGQCRDDAKCLPVFECIYASKCFLFKDIQDKITCVNPCFDRFGLKAVVDSTVSILIDLNVCSEGACASACGQN